MKAVMSTNRRAQWMAGTLAALATLLTMGGSLVLADHYAQSGASLDASGYYAAGQIRRIACTDKGTPRTALVTFRQCAADSRRGLAA